MSHPRIEEVSDSEPEIDSDPDVEDITEFLPTGNSYSGTTKANPSLMRPSQVTAAAQAPQAPRAASQGFDPATAKTWVCLYPVYFDATRTRQEGRRVGKELAVENPFARTIADAVAHVGLRVYFDTMKTHPKDWANPGRIKVELRDEEGNLKRSGVKNKHHLYIHVGKYLKSHPTTTETPLRMPIRGLPMPEEPQQPPAVPRGWKMGSILPLHSAALTGGGVSENLLKDMMNEMSGGGALGSGTSTPGGSKKKEKKKGK